MFRAAALRAVVCLAAAAAPVCAHLPERLDAKLKRIFSSSEFRIQGAGVVRWVDKGNGYTAAEDAKGGGQDLVRYDSASGSREVLVPAAKLTPAGGKPLKLDSYEWSKDGKRLLIFTNSKKVWRNNTRGDYWVLDTGSGKLQKIGGNAEPSMLMFAKFSPDASRVAYVYKNDVWVQDLAKDRVERLTKDGSATIINGTSDWVTEEELFLRDCFRWSPDGRSIAYWQFDQSGVAVYTLVNNTDELYPKLTPIPYPKVGTKNSAVRVGVVSAKGGSTRWLAVAGDPRDRYIPLMEWTKPGELMVHTIDRAQKRITVLLGDPERGSVREIFRDEDAKYLDVEMLVRLGLHWLKGNEEFLWLSERDGWRHAYAVSRGGTARLLTPGDYDVISMGEVDEEGGWLYFTASPQKTTERHLYRVPLKGGAPERVTPEGSPGVHSYDFAPGGGWALHTYSRFDRPPSTHFVRLPAHEPVRQVRDNSKIAALLPELGAAPVEFFRAGEVDGWVVKPRDFDASKKYPVLLHVYGEPGGATVTDSWASNRGHFHRAVAAEGYLIVSLDPIGTPAPRGREWRKAVYGIIGIETAAQIAKALRTYAAEHPYVDLSRVAVWGWSGGGTSTLNLMFRHADLFKVGMAVAPVPDLRLYDSIYQERYMGLLQGSEKGYEHASAINFAEGLRGELLLVHGSGDDNVHYQGTERLVNRLVELGKPFELMVYPNRSHAINEGKGTSLHLYTLLARYLLEHLPAGPR